MQRMYCLQQWFGLSDEGLEGAGYDSQAMRGFIGIDLARESVPDATVIEAPSSTKNETKAGDAEMHQTKKGNAWHVGMKAHFAADADSGLVHSVHAAAANESDVAHVHELLHGQEEVVFADAGYTGAHKRDEIVEAVESGEICADIDWHVAQRRSAIRKMSEGPAKNTRRALERNKAQVPARVEHPSRVLKSLVHHR